MASISSTNMTSSKAKKKTKKTLGSSVSTIPEDYEFGPTTPSFTIGPINMHKELAAVAKKLREGKEQLKIGLQNNIVMGEKN